ncbi:MAG TPA: M20/M25/M40 family metallo-hydrolase [Lacipirellulaceae bacterium]|jgi:acetylornithine deacetylase|nr:M20/M25/M40 family metallo-hydrolase [Lacipirellulaceae bacterium]
MALDPLETLQHLIRTPSVNPMGRPLSDPTHGESRVTELLQKLCEQHDWPWLRQRVHAGRENLVALVRGEPALKDGGELMLWDVHQDTVPVDGMTVAPFGGEVRDGRVYGRGACDVKGAMAAMLAALSRVSEPSAETSPGPSLQGRGKSERPTIVIAFTANEECGFTGARVLCDLWKPGRQPSVEITGGTISPAELFPRRPDAAIVAEPTQFQVVVAHQGVVRWRCHTIGRAAHTSRPDEGINAIYGMAQVVRAVEQYHANLTKSGREHPLCGRPSVCVSTIHGGVGVNTVPERATIEIDRRLGPEDRPAEAYQELIEFISANVDVGRCQVEYDPPFMDSSGLSDKHNRRLAERVATLVGAAGRKSDLVGVPFGTDAAALSAAGVPTIVFGPGSIAQAHTADEFIDIGELQFGAEIFYRMICGN